MTMTAPIAKLNPLNIDYTEIMKKANDRTDALGCISDLIHGKVDAALTGVADAENFFNELHALWKKLDPEGRELLPEEVVSVMRLADDFNRKLLTIAGSKNDGDWGLIHIAGYGMQAKASEDEVTNSILSNFITETPVTPTKGATVIPPTVDSPEITFHGAWNLHNWPNGCWVCCLPHESLSSAGTGADPTAAYNQWLAKR